MGRNRFWNCELKTENGCCTYTVHLSIRILSSYESALRQLAYDYGAGLAVGGGVEIEEAVA